MRHHGITGVIIRVVLLKKFKVNWNQLYCSDSRCFKWLKYQSELFKMVRMNVAFTFQLLALPSDILYKYREVYSQRKIAFHMPVKQLPNKRRFEPFQYAFSLWMWNFHEAYKGKLMEGRKPQVYIVLLCITSMKMSFITPFPQYDQGISIWYYWKHK